MKLNLGSGDKPLEGYANLDGKNGDDLTKLPYTDVEEIRASHILEHFGIMGAAAVLSHWIQCLAPNGVLKIAVPDFDDLIRRYKMGEGIDFEGVIMGGQTDRWDYHKSIWTLGKLKYLMESFGLVDIQTWQSELVDCAALPFSLNLMGRKPCQE